MKQTKSKMISPAKWYYPDAYPETNQRFKMELFVNMNNGFHPLSIFTKSFISGVWLDSD